MIEKKKKSDPQRVLALDIGTRSIVGVLLEKTDGIMVQAMEYLEHEVRSMYDGQIHDVEAVAAEIATIKSRLEESTGLNLKKAAVAAAGRALMTAGGAATASRPFMVEISWEEVQALELEAVQQAQLKIADEETNSSGRYFCVGYSVTSYFLGNQPLQSLVGQTGNKIGVEVIATFLPRVVVDSLLSALKKAHLEAASITLEPIAALTAAIPAKMRLLNLALVDIGAGTSDIAIVQKEKIFAYAMVPIGGDEITETLAEEYLLDFNTAEQVKRQLGNGEILTFVDVLENLVSESTAAIIERIKPVIRDLATSIAREILAVNQEAPDAVICVGGGSLTPGLLEDLAQALELPSNRVGIRTRETISEVKGEHPVLIGPQAITPIGIGLSAIMTRSFPLVMVKVNNHQVPLWGLQEITVSAALLASGINLKSIYGRPGMGLTIELNGILKSFKGTMGSPPNIKVNGRAAGLDTPIREGDSIEFVRGIDGEDARLLVKNLVEERDGVIFLNGDPHTVSPQVLINGQVMGWDEQVPDRSVVELIMGQSLQEFLVLSGIDPDLLKARTYNYFSNGKEESWDWTPCRIWINGEEADFDSQVLFGDRVDYYIQAIPTLREVLTIEAELTLVELTVNNQKVVLPKGGLIVQMNGNEVTLDHPLEEGAVLEVKRPNSSVIVSDLLTQITITPRPSGNLVIRVNGLDAGFTTRVESGDEVELYWEEAKERH